MKKIFIFLMICFIVCGCGKTMKGTNALIEKAQEEMLVSDVLINYAGLCAKEDDALIWFVSGNENQAHTYLPMECKIVGKDEYTFVRSYKPLDRGMDIVVLEWKGGYAFLVNNPNCKTIRIVDNLSTKDISIDKDCYPFVYYYHDLIPLEYQFLDENGNEL